MTKEEFYKEIKIVETLKETSRTYRVAITDCSEICFAQSAWLLDILEGEHEWHFSLQEQVDKLLDLAVGQSMYFQPNRDDKNSKGIILRTV